MVDALSFTEAEARITNEMMPYTSGAFSVSAVKRSNISEIFWDENGDHFYKAKINLITLDENTGAERKKAIYILVQASDLNQAAKNLAEGMRGTVSDYEVASIVKTPIVDAEIARVHDALGTPATKQPEQRNIFEEDASW